MVFKTPAQKQREEMFERMHKKLEERKQIERVVTPATRKVYTEKQIERGKTPFLKKLLQSRKLKKQLKIPLPTRAGVLKLAELKPITKKPRFKRVLSAREKFLIKQIQARQSTSIQNPNAVLREFYKNRWDHLRKAQEENQQVSLATKIQLEKIARIQNMGKIANMRKKRQNAESRILRSSMSMFQAHLNLDKSARLDFTDVKSDNILLAKNLFKEDSENNILRSRPGSRTLLDLGENKLKF